MESKCNSPPTFKNWIYPTYDVMWCSRGVFGNAFETMIITVMHVFITFLWKFHYNIMKFDFCISFLIVNEIAFIRVIFVDNIGDLIDSNKCGYNNKFVVENA